MCGCKKRNEAIRQRVQRQKRKAVQALEEREMRRAARAVEKVPDAPSELPGWGRIHRWWVSRSEERQP